MIKKDKNFLVAISFYFFQWKIESKLVMDLESHAVALSYCDCIRCQKQTSNSWLSLEHEIVITRRTILVKMISTFYILSSISKFWMKTLTLKPILTLSEHKIRRSRLIQQWTFLGCHQTTASIWLSFLFWCLDW